MGEAMGRGRKRSHGCGHLDHAGATGGPRRRRRGTATVRADLRPVRGVGPPLVQPWWVAPAGQDGRTLDDPPHQRHQHHRPARGPGAGATGAPSHRWPDHVGRGDIRGPCPGHTGHPRRQRDRPRSRDARRPRPPTSSSGSSARSACTSATSPPCSHRGGSAGSRAAQPTGSLDPMRGGRSSTSLKRCADRSHPLRRGRG